MKLTSGVILSIFLLLLPTYLRGNESLVDTLMRSDFRLDAATSNAPLPPLAYLTISDYKAAELQENCTDCSLGTRGISQAFASPVWVGKKDLLILGETASWDRINVDQQEYHLASYGLVAAWVQQTTPKLQLAAFTYQQKLGDIADTGKRDYASWYGAVARYRYQDNLHTYFGVLSHHQDTTLYIPYLGFDWVINEEWLLSMLPPWPTITYAPTKDHSFSFGAMPVDRNFVTQIGEQTVKGSLNRWALGFRYKKRLKGWWWLSFSTGVTGLSQLSYSQQNFEIDTSLSSELYGQISIELRPQSY